MSSIIFKPGDENGKKLAPVSLAMFYGASRDFANAFGVRVTLQNPIEPEALRRALDRAMERYPYFSVRLTVQGEDLVLEDNPLPVTIVKGPEPARLNTAASNYHLVGGPASSSARSTP